MEGGGDGGIPFYVINCYPGKGGVLKRLGSQTSLEKSFKRHSAKLHINVFCKLPLQPEMLSGIFHVEFLTNVCGKQPLMGNSARSGDTDRYGRKTRKLFKNSADFLFRK